MTTLTVPRWIALLKHEAALVVQDLLPWPGGLHLRDQHHQLVLVRGLLQLPQVVHDSRAERPVGAMQRHQGHVRVPLRPLLAQALVGRWSSASS